MASKGFYNAIQFTPLIILHLKPVPFCQASVKLNSCINPSCEFHPMFYDVYVPSWKQMEGKELNIGV